MKRILLLLWLLASSCSGLQAQRTTLRTNLLFWGTTTPNAGVEFSLGRNFTLVLDGGYNAWEFSNDMKLNLAFAQPEIRYWFCRRFEGHFIGLHEHYAHFNIGQIDFIPCMKEYVYRGNLYGGGISYGYHWAMGDRWGMEVTVGGGYAQLSYDKYLCRDCGERVGQFKRTYFGPTRAGISLIYFLR